MNLQFYLNGNLVNPPKNWKETAIELNFTDENPDPAVTVTKYQWVNDEAELINTYISQGLTGGYGITEGLPFQIKLDTGEIIFDGYLDLVDTDNEFSCYSVTCNIKEKAKIDFLNDSADSFTFAYLYDLGIITDSDFVDVPYVISAIPDYGQAVMLGISIFIMVRETVDIAEKLTNAISNTASYPPDVITTVLQIAALVVYLAALIIALIELTQSLYDNIIQPTKYHKGMYVRTLLAKAAYYLGYSVNSDIFINSTSVYYNLVIIPEKTKKGKTTTAAGQMGYYNGTFGQFLIDLKTTFDLEVVISGTTIYLNQRTYWQNQANWTMPDVRNDFWSYNIDEMSSNYLIAYTLDTTDMNTYDSYDGTVCQIITYQNIPNIISGMSGLKNLTTVQIPFARSIRKEELTVIEELFQAFIVVLTVLTGGILAITGTASNLIINISNRIGMLLLTSDFIGIPKLLIYDNDKLSQFNKIYTDAVYLWSQFHSIESFKATTTDPANQYIKYNNDNVPFCKSDYDIISNNNNIFDIDGNIGRIDKLEWNIFNETAVINYRINKAYTTNLNEKIIVDEGL